MRVTPSGSPSVYCITIVQYKKTQLMKKILLLVTALMLLSVPGFSQFGIKGGFNFTSFGDIDLSKDATVKTAFEKKTGYHVGLLYKVKIPAIGLAIQPELLYSKVMGDLTVAGTPAGNSNNTPVPPTNASSTEMKMTYLQLPVALQWGVDLMLFRPYIQAVPYIGYSFAKDNGNKDIEWDVNKFRYGVGLGAGLDIWKLQISGRYCWDLGKVADFKWQGTKTFKGGKNKGFELSLAILF